MDRQDRPEAARVIEREPRKQTRNWQRVRLLIAIPVVMVLLITVMSGLTFHYVEQEFGHLRDAPRMQEFAQHWIELLIGFDIAGAVVGFLLAYSITSPIRTLIRISERVAGGDFSHRADIMRRDEMGDLSHSFDYMIDALNSFITTRNRFILESFSGGLITTDVNGTITAINSAAEQVLQLDASQVAGKPVQSVLDKPDTKDLLDLITETLWKQKPVDGKRVVVERGGQIWTLIVNLSIIPDQEGNFFGLIANFRDLGQWQQFYEEMNRADRLAAVGTFATGLAHEIRNPLGAIKGIAQLLAEDIKANPKASEYAKIIVKEVNRLDALVREVQEFSHPAESPGRWTDLNEVVRNSVSLARNTPKAILQEGVQLRENYEELPKTYISCDKVTQALLNIIINACQATPPRGSIQVATRYAENQEQPLRIVVRNSGSYIVPDQLHKIFEPFYTTKDSGSGLGLSIAYQIITYHGGTIEAGSEDNWVSFTIKLPIRDPEDEITL